MRVFMSTITDHGWELYHGEVAQPNVVQMPANLLPANPTPSPAIPMTPPAPGAMK